MKKIFITLLMLVMLSGATQAQQPVRISTDTLPCGVRQPNYYYSSWYDTLDWYLYGSALDSFQVVFNDTFLLPFDPDGFEWDSYGGPCGHTFVFQQYTPGPLRIRGLWAMVSQYKGGDPKRPTFLDYVPLKDSARMPEYMYLYTPRDTSQHFQNYGSGELLLDRIATVRWDTAHPKMMCFQKTLDPAFADARSYCHVYEAMFDTVQVLEGEFWIGGSNYSCVGYHPGGPGVPDSRYDCFPTTYVAFGGDHPLSRYVSRPYSFSALSLGPDGPHGGFFMRMFRYGPFGVITDDQRYVEVATNNPEQGIGQFSAFYPDSSYQTITAVPNRGFRFDHWNDSVTDNPRIVFVTSDTVFTAHFEPIPQYEVEVESSDQELGYVSGRGTYYEGDTVVVEAVPHSGNHFKWWSDSVTANPRSIVVTQDTLLVAIFGRGPLSVREAEATGVAFRLVPNPASSAVRCETGGEGFGGGVLTLSDATGREVLQCELAAGTRTLTIDVAELPSGTYFVTLTTAKGTSTQKLVIN